MLVTKRRDTPPELRLRSALHRLGLRYAVDEAPLKGIRRRADVLFRSSSVAVFVDGCFWHGCPTHGTWPKQNAEWWRKKIEANRKRDADTDRTLHERGWAVVRVWSHEDPQTASHLIAALVCRQRRFTKRRPWPSVTPKTAGSHPGRHGSASKGGLRRKK